MKPNARTPFYLRNIFQSDKWRRTEKTIPIIIGQDANGRPIFADLATMPHLLVAGADGDDTTSCIHGILASLLCRFSPTDLRLMLMAVEVRGLRQYNQVPHLIVPAVTEATKATDALLWVVREMEKRFEMFARAGVRNITGFNASLAQQAALDGLDETQIKALREAGIAVPDKLTLPIKCKLPVIVVIVEELAPLMSSDGNDVEMSIARLSALGRAAGIHLIVATRHPIVNILTGVIKANITGRIAFRVNSEADSRVILDAPGAEKLHVEGEMLYQSDDGKMIHAQGVRVLDEEVDRIVDIISTGTQTEYDANLYLKLSGNNPTNAQEPWSSI
jgi:S-DNA-T family DNA segregation ATPase FtsK/SpoIIIE